MSNLLKDNPKLMSEYNYEKNDQLDLEKITLGSNKKVWWKCLECETEWQAAPHNRTKSKPTGCPKCGIKKIGKNKRKELIRKNGSLFDNKPDLASEWNYKKNYPLTPNDVTTGSHKKVWWHCYKCNNDWEAVVYNRAVLGSGCIYCTNQKAIVGVNDFKTLYPQLTNEWDYEKNGELLPENFKPKSNIRVWWKCELGHSWQSSINKRTSGTSCPKCFFENGTSFAEQAILYYLSKKVKVENRIKIFDNEIDIFLPDLNIGFEYDGIHFHNTIKSKIKEETKNIIMKENNITLFRIKESNKSYFDKNTNIIYCIPDRDYNYLEKVLTCINDILNLNIENIDISRDRLIIYNQYVKSIKQHSIAKECPELLKEWDYQNNGDLKPENFKPGSNVKVWWKCLKCNSLYESTISHKTEGTNCPFCSGKKVNETNNLKNKYPKLSNTWDYEKNGELKPENVYYSSRKKVWWICPKCKESFSASVCTRIKAKEYDCSKCMHKRIGNANRLIAVSKNKSLKILKPDLSKEWNYEKNNKLTPENVSCGSGIKVWWKCSKCGYEWQAKIFNRSYGTGCPKCYKKRRNSNE